MRAHLGRYASLLLIAPLGTAACEGDNSLVRLQASGVFEPDHVDFGEVGVELTQTRTVVFRNTGQAPFVVENFTKAPSFIVKGLEVDTTIPGGATVELEATFFAAIEGARDETLSVRDTDVDVTLQLTANGVLRMVPQLEQTPEALDFGVVEIGATGRLPFALDNTGNAPATITSATFMSGTDTFSVLIPGPIIVQEGIRGVFPVSFSPPAEGNFEDALVLEIAELEEPVVIPLAGEGGDPAGAVFCTPASVVFEELPRGQMASQDVTCSARGAALTVDAIAFEDPEVPFAVTPPALPMMIPQDGTFTVPVSFVPNALPGEVEGRLAIQYTNQRGMYDVTVPITGTIGPPAANDQAISVTLRWDKENTDVDLHLIRPEGSMFDRENLSDCHYANKDPDWGASGDTTDNPFLDVDDVDGFGPETINMARASNGEYELKIHYFDSRDRGPVVATVEVFIGGTMVATRTSEPLAEQDVWTVGTIKYEDGQGTFAEEGGCTCVTRGARTPSASLLFGLFGLFGLVLEFSRRSRA